MWGRRRLDRRPAAVSEAPPACTFRDLERLLTLFAAGLTGGALTLAENREATERGAYTDGQTVFLPAQLPLGADRRAHLRLYKGLVAHAAAQVWYGSLAEELRARMGQVADPQLAAYLYTSIEGARLSAQLAADFPGLGRDLAASDHLALARRPLPAGGTRVQVVEGMVHVLLGNAPPTGLSRASATALRELLALLPHGSSAAATASASLDLAFALSARLSQLRPAPLPPALLSRSAIRFDRLRRDVPAFPAPPPPAALPRPPDLPPERHPAGPTLVVEGQGPPPQLPNEERRGDAPAGRQVAVSYADTASRFTARLVPLSAEERRGAFVYPEWDATTGSYRPDWCALRPRRPRAAGTDYVERVLRRRHAQAQALKRQFETLRPERLRLHRQADGEDLDLDVVVEAHVDRRLGLPPAERPYSHVREQRRDIGVAFLVDLSGSMGGYLAGGERVIDVAKQALVLLCEALSVLDDRYAIYGFSGSTRKGCEFYTVKDFAEGYDDEVKRRLGGLLPLSYTRLGPPIRHTTSLLSAVAARVRLLLLLSDGRPNDFDAYGGAYGVEDTRRALLEARGHGLRTFCLTIDAEARDYMPRLFGAGNYVTLSRVEALPRTLPDLYRRLTQA